MSTSQIAQEILMNAVAMDGETSYSDSVNFRLCTGSAALIIISTAGTLAISQQCSMDNNAWYDPIDTAAAALGVVKAAQTVTAGVYVVFTPVLSEWIRFKVIESTAATTVTLKLLFREEV